MMRLMSRHVVSFLSDECGRTSGPIPRLPGKHSRRGAVSFRHPLFAGSRTVRPFRSPFRERAKTTDGGTVAADSLGISWGCDETRMGRPRPRGGLAEAIRILSEAIEVLDESIVGASEIRTRKTI